MAPFSTALNVGWVIPTVCTVGCKYGVGLADSRISEFAGKGLLGGPIRMQNQKINPNDAYQTFMVIWVALFVSQFLFVGLTFFIKPELLRFDLRKPLFGENTLVVIAVAAISVADLAVSFVLRNRFLARSVAEQNIGMVQTAMIVGCSLAEAISLFGLLLAFAFNYQYFFLFSAFGMLAMVLHLPRRSDIAAASFKM